MSKLLRCSLIKSKHCKKLHPRVYQVINPLATSSSIQYNWKMLKRMGIIEQLKGHPLFLHLMSCWRPPEVHFFWWASALVISPDCDYWNEEERLRVRLLISSRTWNFMTSTISPANANRNGRKQTAQSPTNATITSTPKPTTIVVICLSSLRSPAYNLAFYFLDTYGCTVIFCSRLSEYTSCPGLLFQVVYCRVRWFCY